MPAHPPSRLDSYHVQRSIDSFEAASRSFTVSLDDLRAFLTRQGEDLSGGANLQTVPGLSINLPAFPPNAVLARPSGQAASTGWGLSNRGWGGSSEAYENPLLLGPNRMPAIPHRPNVPTESVTINEARKATEVELDRLSRLVFGIKGGSAAMNFASAFGHLPQELADGVGKIGEMLESAKVLKEAQLDALKLVLRIAGSYRNMLGKYVENKERLDKNAIADIEFFLETIARLAGGLNFLSQRSAVQHILGQRGTGKSVKDAEIEFRDAIATFLANSEVSQAARQAEQMEAFQNSFGGGSNRTADASISSGYVAQQRNSAGPSRKGKERARR